VALWIGAQTINIHYVINILALVTAILYASCHLSLTLREEQALARGEVDPSAPLVNGKEKKNENDEEEEEDETKGGPPQYETLRLGEAMQFPLLGSASLFGLYTAFKYFDKDTVNLIISFYFCLVGLVACTSTLGPIIEYSTTLFFGTTTAATRTRYGKTFSMKHPLPNFIGGPSPWIYKLDCSTAEILAFIGSSVFIARYFVTKHWTYNNILGICFCIQGIERFSLGTYKIGAILLIGLFFYDIFWVFGTDVMVTVAKSLDGPIKLLFPKSIVVKDVVSGKIDMSLLGLGDIVLPGFFLSLLLRFDAHMANVPALPTNVHAAFDKPYFHSGLVGYIVGLATTLYVMIGESVFILVLVFQTFFGKYIHVFYDILYVEINVCVNPHTHIYI
jgi:minor histocompatibility antigen H13